MTQFEQGKILIQELLKSGYEAYFVGGCVRDMALGLIPADYDITTSATPDEIQKVFDGKYKYFNTNTKYGTVTIETDNGFYEITTYRTESDYTDYRHPSVVNFVSSLEEDLSRRDFTVNAMAMSIDGKLIDPYGGQADLKAKIIKAVGNAEDRFTEDPLRIMRAFRFSAKLSARIEKNTMSAIVLKSNLLSKISKDRIFNELSKILLLNPEKIREMQAAGVLKVVLPEVSRLEEKKQINPNHYTDAFNHTVDTLVYAKAFKLPEKKLYYVMWSLLLHDTGKYFSETVGDDGYMHYKGHPEYSYQIACQLLKDFGMPSEDREIVTKLIHYHDEVLVVSRKMLFKIITKFNMTLFEYKLFGYVREADIAAHVKRENDDRMERYYAILKMYKQKQKTDKLFTIDKLAISGKEIMNILSLEQGKIVGDVKQALFEMCFCKPSLNTAEYLTKYLKEHKTDFIK